LILSAGDRQIIRHRCNRDAEQARYTPIVYDFEGTVFANSRDVAAFFEKRHDNVLRDIDNLIAQGSSDLLLNFEELVAEVEIGSGAKRLAKAYAMTRDGFTLLAMGFTGKKALGWKLKYIEAFNKMEAELAKAASQPADNSPPRAAPAADRKPITITMDWETARDFMEGYAVLRSVGTKIDADVSYPLGVAEDLDYGTCQMSMARHVIKAAMR